MSDWCEIFRAGTYKDSEGKEREYTEEDIDTIINNFNEDKNPSVPNVVGHPKLNAPAYGWVDKLKRSGKSMYAKFKQVPQEFKNAVNSGWFKNRSISLYPDLKLRHIGWLGAAAPKVKGMEEFQFSENETQTTIEFSDLTDFKFKTVSDVLDNLRDFLIGKYGLETANNVISRYQSDFLKRIENKTPQETASFCEGLLLAERSLNCGAAAPDENKRPIGCEPVTAKRTALANRATLDSRKEQNLNNDDPKNIKKDEKEEITKLENSFAELTQKFEEKSKEKDEQLKQMRGEIEKMEKRNREYEFEQFADELVSAGNITPAVVPFVKDLLEIAHLQGTYDFSEGEEKSVKTRIKDFFKTLKCVNFATIAEKPKKNEENTLDFSDGEAVKEAIEQRIFEEKQKGREISAKQALNLLRKENKNV